jgi:hypothetical protein
MATAPKKPTKVPAKNPGPNEKSGGKMKPAKGK